MIVAIDILLLVIAAVLAVPTAVLAVEVAASLLARRRLARAQGSQDSGDSSMDHPRIAVIVPAHNEEAVLGRTLASITSQLTLADRLIVVADNCQDATAAVARGAGAMCIERQNPKQRGKGFALDAGVRALEADPPDVVIVTDADVYVVEGALGRLAAQALRIDRPAQGEYLMSAPAQARSVDLVSWFAFTFKNKVRPLGLWHLGLPCPFFGSGMAFAWETIRTAPLANADLVEDMRLGLDLGRRGQTPLFCPTARFHGVLPTDADDANTQRRRWEHGHLNMLRRVPGLLAGGLARLDWQRVAMALDHLVQPLTVLCAELLILLAAALTWWLVYDSPLGAVTVVIAVACFVVMFLSLAVAWAAHMRRQIPPSALLGLPRYLASRVKNQAGWLFHRQKDWIRTPRAEEHTDGPDDPGAGGSSPPTGGPIPKTPESAPPANHALASGLSDTRSRLVAVQE